ncbi:MAG TPA: SpoIIE family protein phosphatase [Roseiflexaceae bacterium]|nr:SpoIIE family protein phosphatase [Roseiflexaceae bacterium]
MPALPDSQRRVAELTTLNALAQTLNRALDLREALDSVLPHIVELMGLETGWIFLSDENGGYRLAARHQLPPAIEYPGQAWQGECTCQELCSVGKLNKAVNVVRCSRLRYALGDKRSLAQHASVPLLSGDELVGILNVATTEFGRFSPAQLQLLSAIGFSLGTAIARARLHEQVKVRRVHEQGALLRLSHELLGATSIEQALQRLVRVGARLLEADACAYIEADEQGGQAILVAAHGWDIGSEAALPLVFDAVNPHLWYLPENSSHVAVDALDDLPPLMRTQAFQGHLALTVEINAVPIGMLMVNSHASRRFLVDEVQLLGLLGSQLAQTLERERLHQEALARHRLEQELDLARSIQSGFLPDCCPVLPGYEISAFYRAARQVGGDFYDFIDLPDVQSDTELAAGSAAAYQADLTFWRTGRLPPPTPRRAVPAAPSARRFGIVIADVTDKGVPAALFMVLSRTLIRATASDGREPADVLARANHLILSDARSGLFVTCFYGILDTQEHTYTYANGGHNYPLVYRAAFGEVEQLQAQGIVLGIVPDPQFAQRTTTLEPGDVLCLYTDGVTEAMDGRRQFFEEERLIEVLRRSHHLDPEQIIDRILDAVTAFMGGAPQNDDVTLVVLKRQH